MPTFLLLVSLMFKSATPSAPPPRAVNGRPSPRSRWAGFPRVDQLHERLPDGRPSENAQMNCIPASIAAGLEFITGKPYSGAGIKQAVYGGKYLGPTQIYRYLDWVHGQGVTMRPVLSHNPEVLVAELRSLLERGIPAVITIPGDLERPASNPLHPGGVTHVVVAAGFDENGNIRAMNPWGGVWLSGSDAFWAARIAYGELWPMEPADASPPRVEPSSPQWVSTPNPAVPHALGTSLSASSSTGP